MLYKEAANILKLASEEGGMVKNLIFSSEYEVTLRKYIGVLVILT